MTTSRIRRTVITVGLAGGVAALGGTAIAQAATSPSTPASSSTSSATSSAPTPGGRPPGPPGPGGGARPNPANDADGRITAVSSSSLTVKSAAGTTRSYVLNSSTTVHEGPGHSVSTSALAVGEHVHVRGQSSSSTLTAIDVDVLLPHIDGVVSAVNGNRVTVTDPDGFTRTITTSGSTTYTKSGSTVSSSSVAVGSSIHATGTVDANGTSLDATSIELRVPGERPAGPAGGPKPAPPAARQGSRPAPPAPSSSGSSSAPSTAAPSVTGS